MNILATVVPVFALIFGGWIAARTHYISETVGRGLTEFVFSLAVPALIFNALTRSSTEGEIFPGFWVAYFGGAALVWLACGLFARHALGRSTRDATMLGFSTSQSNTVFVGVPLILHTFGDAGALPLFMLLALHMPVMMGAAMLAMESDGQRGMLGSLTTLARNLLRNPMFLALLAGALVRAMGWTPQGALADILLALGGTASTCALFALGASIQRLSVQTQWSSAGLVCAGKLLLHPLAVWLLATRVFTMPPVFAGVATLFACMPVGINSYLLAERYQAAPADIAVGVALSTAVSVLSVSLWLLLLSPAQ